MNKEKPVAAKQISKQAGKGSLAGFTHYTHTALVQTIYFQANVINHQRRNNLILMVITAVLVITLAFVSTRPDAEPVYFGWDGSKFTSIKPLSHPPANLNAARTWTEGCIIDALDLSFINPIKRINSIINECFNENGKLAYQRWLTHGVSSELVSLGKAGSVPIDSELGEIISKRIAIDASIKAPSRILPIESVIDPKTNEEILRWQVSFPLIIRKEISDVKSGTATIIAKIVLIRNNSKQFPYGVAIDSFALERG